MIKDDGCVIHFNNPKGNSCCKCGLHVLVIVSRQAAQLLQML